MGDREGTEGVTATGRGGIAWGEENGGREAVISLLVGLWWHWTARMRMTVVAHGIKQQPIPLWQRWRRWQTWTAMVDDDDNNNDDDDEETARYYLVGPDDGGEDGSWWGV